MAFDATVGGVSANSYATVEYAVAYLGNLLNKDSFLTAELDIQQKALMTATQQLELETFRGTPTTTTQALQFPMDDIFDKNGNEFDNTQIPTPVLQACSLLAESLLNPDSPVNNSDFVNVKAFSHDTTQIEYATPLTNSDVEDFPDDVYILLSGILASKTTEVVRM